MLTHHKIYNLPFLNQDPPLLHCQFLSNIMFLFQASTPPYVLEVLFGGVGIPFWKDISVVDNIMGILGNLDGKGLLGLVGAFVLIHLLKK